MSNQNKIKISPYYMSKRPVITQEELLRRISDVKMQMESNEENIKKLLSEKHLKVVSFWQGDIIKTYHRTPEDFIQLKLTVKNLEMQNWKLKKELEILKSLEIYE